MKCSVGTPKAMIEGSEPKPKATPAIEHHRKTEVVSLALTGEISDGRSIPLDHT